jgi:prophage DNA circulation protein
MGPLVRHIVRAAYDGLEFPTLEVSDENGHDFAKHEAWRVNGADIEHTGRKARSFSLKIALLTSFVGWPDDLFPRLHDELEDKFSLSPQGTLTHPYYGQVSVQVVSWKRTFDPQVQQGVMLDVEFIERNASAYRSFANFDPEPGDALTDAAAAADAAAEALGAANQEALTDLTQTQLEYLESEDRSSDEAYASLKKIQDAANANLVSEELVGIDGHDAREALRTVLARTWDYARTYLTPRSQPRVYEVPQMMSLQRIAALVYGDPTRTEELRKANRIPDEAFVPQGTVLSLPEAP